MLDAVFVACVWVLGSFAIGAAIGRLMRGN